MHYLWLTSLINTHGISILFYYSDFVCVCVSVCVCVCVCVHLLRMNKLHPHFLGGLRVSSFDGGLIPLRVIKCLS